MGRQFVAANSEHFVTASTPVTAAPFTMAMWFYYSSEITSQEFAYIGDRDVATHYWVLSARSGRELRFTARAGGANNLTTTDTFTLNTWNHACAVERSSTDRSVFLNGGGEITSSTSIVPATVDAVGLGARTVDTPSQFFDGRIAEVGIWNIGLAEFDVKRLAQGYSPPLVRPEHLVSYWSLRTENYNYDPILPPHIQQPANLLTNFGSTFTGHPPNIIYPLGHLRIPILAPQAVAGVTMPKFYHHYQRNTG